MFSSSKAWQVHFLVRVGARTVWSQIVPYGLLVLEIRREKQAQLGVPHLEIYFKL